MTVQMVLTQGFALSTPPKWPPDQLELFVLGAGEGTPAPGGVILSMSDSVGASAKRRKTLLQFTAGEGNACLAG